MRRDVKVETAAVSQHFVRYRANGATRGTWRRFRPAGPQVSESGPAGRNGDSTARRRTFVLAPGDVVSFITPGSGGFGPPLERNPQRVLLDVLDGKVSPEVARRTHRVAIDAAAKAIDWNETRRLRTSAGMDLRPHDTTVMGANDAS